MNGSACNMALRNVCRTSFQLASRLVLPNSAQAKMGNLCCWLTSPNRLFHHRVTNCHRGSSRSGMAYLKGQSVNVVNREIMVQTSVGRSPSGSGISNLTSKVVGMRSLTEMPDDDGHRNPQGVNGTRVESLLALVAASGQRRHERETREKWRTCSHATAKGSSNSSSVAESGPVTPRTQQPTTTYPTPHQLRRHFINAMIPMSSRSAMMSTAAGADRGGSPAASTPRPRITTGGVPPPAIASTTKGTKIFGQHQNRIEEISTEDSEQAGTPCTNQSQVFVTGEAHATVPAQLKHARTSNRSSSALPFSTTNAWALLRCISVGDSLEPCGTREKLQVQGPAAESQERSSNVDGGASFRSRLVASLSTRLLKRDGDEKKANFGHHIEEDDDDDDDQAMVVVVGAAKGNETNSSNSRFPEHDVIAGEGEDVEIYCSRSAAAAGTAAAAVWGLQRNSEEYSWANDQTVSPSVEDEATITMHDGGKVEPIIGYVARTGKPVMCVRHKSVGSPRAEQQEPQHHWGISRSILCYPIFDDMDRDRVIGVIELVDKHSKDRSGAERIEIFTREDERLVRMLSGHLSLYLALGSFYKHSGSDDATGPMEKCRWICPLKSNTTTSKSSVANRIAPDSRQAQK